MVVTEAPDSAETIDGSAVPVVVEKARQHRRIGNRNGNGNEVQLISHNHSWKKPFLSEGRDVRVR